MEKLRLSLGFLAAVSLASMSCSPEGDPATTGTGGSAATGGSSGAGTGGNATAGTGGSSGAGTGGNDAGTGGNSPGTGGSSSGSGGSGAGTGGSGSGGQTGSGGSSSGGSMGGGGRGAGGMGMGGAGTGTGGATGGAGMGSGGAAGGSSGGGGTIGGAGATENSGSNCMASAAGTKKNMKLPDPFAMHDGTRITTKAQWECRRNEIKKDLEKYEIGPKPEPASVSATLSGTTLTVTVTTSAGSLTLTSKVTTASGTDNCVAIGMNGNASLISGCVQVPFMHDDVVKYGSASTQYQSDPFYKVYPELWGKVGNYSAWAWGISRLIDGIDKVKDQLKVDMTKIGVQGCSYAGKMALFGGAFDERVALTMAEESGGGGINSWRTSQDFYTRTKTNIEKIDNTNYSWFLSSMKSLDPYSLPHDHHELIAMVAPRAFVTFGNQDYEWLGDESGYKSVNAAKEVWKAMGIEDHIGYDFTSNHNHCRPPASQTNTAAAFVDRFLKGKTANTAIYIKPQEGNFDLDYTNVIDWQTPTLQ
jgi:hypothetical protein